MLLRHRSPACPPQARRKRVPASHDHPPGSPSNSAKLSLSQSVTFSPTLRPHNSFTFNTYGLPCKCCKQKTYGKPNSFRCNTYKKQGGCPSTLWTLPLFHSSTFRLFDCSSFRRAFDLSPLLSSSSALFSHTKSHNSFAINSFRTLFTTVHRLFHFWTFGLLHSWTLGLFDP
jgi:hypothetical protein